MKEIILNAIKLLERGKSFAIATIITQSGSAPRHSGSCMIIEVDGSIIGTVGGGALEARVQQRARDVLAQHRATILDFDLTTGDATRLGMVCGGRCTVMIEYIAGDNRDFLEVFGNALSAIETGTRARIVTYLPVTENGKMAGIKVLLRSDGAIIGGSKADPTILSELSAQVGRYHTFTLLYEQLVLVEPVGNDGTAYIFGAGHVGQKLTPVLSSIGFRTVVFDDRDEFANRGRLPAADQIIVLNSFDKTLDNLAIDENSYIIIVTRGHLHDREVLQKALRTNAGYIGMIGSRKKRDFTYKALLQEGFSQLDLNRVYSPIGMEIKAETPEEIAISIAAELIKIRAEQKKCQR
jgi:xanthine dehydrogenase accessory factor